MECQEDFALPLTVPQGMMELIACNDAFCGSGRSLKIETMDYSQVQEAPYIPVNEIKPEVLAMLVAWESAKLERQQAQKPDSAMQVVPLESSDSFEFERYVPSRCCHTTEPPKRFYRTFWRSISRRIVQNTTYYKI